ncbi:myomegalin isoform X7 [Tachysurus ichikawai]
MLNLVTNIELKVEVESLKQELLERQQQLDKALRIQGHTSFTSMLTKVIILCTERTTEKATDQNGAEAQCRCEEKQQEISHIQEVLENKIQLLQEEANLARSEAERLSSLAASESQRCADLKSRMMEMESKEPQEEMLAENERLIQTLVSKEEEISSLQEERDLLNHRVTQLEEELQVLNKSFRDLKVYGFTHNAILKIRNQ